MKITGLPSARAAAISRPEPPAAVSRGRIARVGPGRSGQHGRGFDEDQVGTRAFQHHVRVVRQQRVHGRVRGERGAAACGQHPGDDQPRRGPAGRLVRMPIPAAGRPSPGAVSADRNRSPPPARSPSCADASASVAAPGPVRPPRSRHNRTSSAGSCTPRDQGRRAARTRVRPSSIVADCSSAVSRACVMASCSRVSRNVRASRSRSASRSQDHP